VSAKRGDRVAPPAPAGQWEVVFGTSEAAKGWADLCAQAPGNTYEAWLVLRSDPLPTVRTPRHHPMKGSLSTGTFRGRSLPCWQVEVTSGGRIWYLVDAEARKVIVVHASTGHPRATG